MTAAFDRTSRSLQDLAANFDSFGEVECPQLDARLYQAMCRGTRDDPELLSIAARAPATQPPVNLLFGAVHYLLLGGEPHPLREWYPALAEGAANDPGSVFAPFREFCLAHRARIEGLIETRLTQTNIIQRCSALLPAFARVFAMGAGPLALVEIGPSAGLNLQWDRFRSRYRKAGAEAESCWGDPDSPVLVECELRGDTALPERPAKIPVASRCGVDIHPIDLGDPDEVLWLRALVWPDHVGRQERLTAAIDVARQSPPPIVQGDASVDLAPLLAAAPDDATICVYGTHTLYQFPHAALIATLKSMQEASRDRPVHFVGIEGTGDRCSELKHTLYRGGQRETTLVARCNPHGRWLEWLEG